MSEFSLSFPTLPRNVERVEGAFLRAETSLVSSPLLRGGLFRSIWVLSGGLIVREALMHEGEACFFLVAKSQHRGERDRRHECFTKKRAGFIEKLEIARFKPSG